MADSHSAVALVDSYLAGELEISEFCDRYERWWNFERRPGAVGAAAAALEALFDIAARYSPYPEDRAKWPGYQDEASVRAAAAHARAVAGDERSGIGRPAT